jgi:hypothetical protein
MVKSAAIASVEALTSVALHYFSSVDDAMTFPKIHLPGLGVIDCVLARHAPMRPEIEDFVLICDEAGRKRPVKRLQLEAVCKFWDVKGYILLSERQYDGLTSGDGGSFASYNPDHSVRLVVCKPSQDTSLPPLYQFSSVAGNTTTVLQHEGIDLPSREELIQRLSTRLRRTMLSQIRAMVRTKEADYVLSRSPSIA